MKSFAHLAVALSLVSSCRARPDQSRASGETDSTSTPAWLAGRAREQAETARGSATFHAFAFHDAIEASGITFRHRIVDDAGKDYKRVHYDHGTGIAAADVDGDGLIDVYFVNQLGSSELWKNTGGGHFTNITDQAGLRVEGRIGVAAAFADIDNDGDPDLFITTVRGGNMLFENLGGGKFRDITAQAGVGYVGHSSGAVFFDFDNDGLVDLFVANVGNYTTSARNPQGFYVGREDAFKGHLHPDRAEASILYKNMGGNRFKDVSRETGLVDVSWSGDATPIDVNEDGYLDLYVLDMQGENHLWLNDHGKRFHDATAQYFPKTPWGAMGVKAFDFNGDGRVDLFVTDMHSDMFVNVPPTDGPAENRKVDSAGVAADFILNGKGKAIFGNALFANRGAGRFEEVSDAIGVENYWPWGPSVDDLNADGWEDIFIASSMNFPHRYGINTVLLNEAGKHFLRSEFLLGIEPRRGGVTEQPWFTLDCKGADAGNPFCSACRRPGPARAECQHVDSAGRFTFMGSRGTRSAVIFDVDNDGDLDIITNEFNAPPQVLLSDLSTRRQVHCLVVRLRGTHSNREGLGARVTLVLPDGRRLLKVMDGRSGYLSQSVLPLYFGLDQQTTAQRLEVTWLGGRPQVVEGPFASGQTIDVVETEPPATR